ncbi:glycosyltransferase [Asaia bogorensis]|uniref:glycosyltransferase n=1 Tax=Asaia bogorensis TaxID=91915 RepID=UPI002863B01D|nr:glycosyltransferase [Asaia bogorensis]MDR6183233.1 hopene-associated glycosyltransferase HpnB [Asaia bogorensis NBRC 16594]
MIRHFMAASALAAWGKLLFGHGRFWRTGERLAPGAGTTGLKPGEKIWPDVAIVVPARDEAESIQACVATLVQQDYQGKLSVIVVDDGSTDGTGDLARQVADPHKRLTVLTGKARPEGWSGKLWAVHQGECLAREKIDANGFVLLTDADILHSALHLETLVEKAERDGLDMVSEMVVLNCESAAERLLVPAFVYFFAMLYPFEKVNDPASPVAGAAGGTILVRRSMLERIGGVESVRGALIDDCSLAADIKKAGGKLYLGHSMLAWSIRPYRGAGDIWRMIARTAYVQLRYSPIILLCTVLGMTLVWLAPVYFALFGRGRVRVMGGASLLLAVISFLPTLSRFKLSPVRALALPVVAAFYMAATLGSAVDHHRGRGVQWKSRFYTEETHA